MAPYGSPGRRTFVVRLRLPSFGPTHMVLTLAILLLGLFAYAFLQTAAQSYRLREMEREMLVEVQDLRLQRAELEGLATYLESDEYVEAFARQQFGLVRPGEILVLVDAPESGVPPRHPGERWWEALFDTSVAPVEATNTAAEDAVPAGDEEPPAEDAPDES